LTIRTRNVFLILICIPLFTATGASVPDTLDTQAVKDSLSVQTHHVPDGVYRGCSEAFRDTLWVEVKDSLIADVRVIRHLENRPLGALRIIPYLIQKNQNLDSIQAVTGATVTSWAIVRAVRSALGLSPAPRTPEKSLQ
jgi:uncharacterized protein with FMN-binding domain